MKDRIKLNSVYHRKFDSQTGEPIFEFNSEFTCSGCRHLVGESDKFCWHCGEELFSEARASEYYSNVGKISRNDFEKIKLAHEEKRSGMELKKAIYQLRKIS